MIIEFPCFSVNMKKTNFKVRDNLLFKINKFIYLNIILNYHR